MSVKIRSSSSSRSRILVFFYPPLFFFSLGPRDFSTGSAFNEGWLKERAPPRLDEVHSFFVLFELIDLLYGRRREAMQV
jgi:hypothetical protein